MAEAKKRLKELPFENTGLNRKLAIRMMKLVKPRCKFCAKRPGWAERCKCTPIGPYFSMQAIEDPAAQMTFNKETGTWQLDEDKPKKIVDYRIMPNIAQVPLTIRVDSGLGLEAAFARGYKRPEDVQPLLEDGSPDPIFDGFAPMCEFQNCHRPNPKIKTTHAQLRKNNRVPPGHAIAFYCTEDHAKRARLKDSEAMRWIPEADEESANKAVEQLANVSL